jgi:hypothetical protein
MGTLMMLFFFVAAWEFEFGIVNQHLVYGIATAAVGVLRAGEVFGIDAIVEKAPVVCRAPALRYVLG